MKNHILIFAHPDDEIIFSSSLINSAKKIIICFSEIEDNKLVSKGRKKLLKDELFSKMIFLQIPQSANDNSYYLPSNIKIKNNIFSNKEIGKHLSSKFSRNSNLLLELLKKNINYGDKVFTHNPWGEYGHFEHIQVFNTLLDLKIKDPKKFTLFVNGYFSRKSYSRMLLTSNILELQPLKFKSNNSIYSQYRNKYKLYKCWTWYENYKLPKFEHFYQVKDILTSKNRKYKNYRFKFMLGDLIENNAINNFLFNCLKNLIDNYFSSLSVFLIKIELCILKRFYESY